MSIPKHTVIVGGLVRNEQEEILLVRHHRRGWEVPQGKVEEGESLIEAVHREIMEESGVTVELGPLAAVWSKISPPAALIMMFIVRLKGGELTPSDETPELGWFTEEEARNLITHPINRDRLATLLDFNGTTVYQSYSVNPYNLKDPDAYPDKANCR